jgi:ATP dependent DNA ligase-like protein
VGQPEIQTDQTIKKPKATWVEPKFFADVEYRDITSEGLLRPVRSKDFRHDGNGIVRRSANPHRFDSRGIATSPVPRIICCKAIY